MRQHGLLNVLKSRCLPVSVSVPSLDPAFALHVLPHSGADRLARLAARACGVPIAIIAALENDEAQFVAGTGFSAQEREGLVALCEATLETPPRQPLLPARCAPEVGFYRGLPLSREDGTLLGVLAVMDKPARGLSPEQEEDLETLAGLAAAQLEARHAGAPQAAQTGEDAQRLATRLGITLESITEGFYTLDPQWRFSYLNREGARLLGRPPTELLGKSIWKEFGRDQHLVLGAGARGGGGQLPGGVRGPVCAARQMVRDTRLPLSRRGGDLFPRRQRAAQGARAAHAAGDQHLAAQRHRDDCRSRSLGPARAAHHLRQQCLRAAHGLQPGRGAGPFAAPAVRPVDAAQRTRALAQRLPEGRTGAGRTHHLQKERPAFLDGSRHRAGGRRCRRVRHALGGGGARHHAAQGGGKRDQAPGLLRPADPVAEPPAADGKAGQGAAAQPPASARRRADVHRPGQLQDAQRHHGPPEGRPAAAAGGQAPGRLRAADRHGGAPGRRRICGHAGGPGPGPR